MRILLLLEDDTAPVLESSLAHRGHRVARRQVNGDLSGVDLIIADAEIAARTQLVAKVSSESPGIEFVLVGAKPQTKHPDIIAQLETPLDVRRVLAIVDETAHVLDGERLRAPIDLLAYETVFAGDSPHVRDLLRRVRLVARNEAPVWIFGEDGSGRGIVARAIHDRSTRRGQPYLAFNTAAYSDDELARILFEGEDAAIHKASRGSLFLERIGATGPNTQRELALYLEKRSNDDTSARLIMGIQRDKANSGPQSFIAPELYYRLKVLELEIPALRERVRDLEEIVNHMLRRLAPDEEPQIGDKAMSLLERYDFPGNLLELSHALTHAYVLARGSQIEVAHLPISIRQAAGETNGNGAHTSSELEALDVVIKRFERDYLLRVLRSVAGNRGRAAEILGLSRKGLWGKLKAHAISDDDIEHHTVS